MKEHKYLLNPLFGICILLLIVNDFWLKEAFHNSITGKLSDVSGIIACLLFLKSFFPKSRFVPMLATAVVFSLWNSSLVTPFIESANHFGASFSRTIDWTDHLCLVVLPIANQYIPQHSYRIGSFSRTMLLLGVMITFCQTTCTRYRHLAFYDGIDIDPEFELRLTEDETVMWEHVQLGFAGAELSRDSVLRKNKLVVSHHIKHWPADSTFVLNGKFSFTLNYHKKKNKTIVDLSYFKFFPDSTFYQKHPVDHEDVKSMCNDFLRYKLYRTSAYWR